MKRYDAYRHSGIDWIGEIPSGWNVLPLKRVIQQERQITYGIVQPGEVDPNGRFMIRGQDYSFGWNDPEKIFRVSSQIEEPYKRSRVKENDILLTIVGAGTGNLSIVPKWLDGANLTQTTARIAINEEKANHKFVYFLLQSEIGKANARIWIKGAAQPGLNLGHVKIFNIILPKIEEQNVIVDYLEGKVQKIDQVIQQKELLLEKLQAKRQAIINEAVTKGLNPNVPMKPSGVEWLGDIPEHWHAKQIKHIKDPSQNSFVDGPFGSNLKSEHFIEDGPVLVIESGFITKGQFIEKKFKTISQEHFETIKRSECKEGDIIISKIGANYGMSGILPDLGRQAVVSGNSMKLTVDKERCNIEFIHFCLLFLKTSGVLKLIVNETAQPALSLGTMNNLHIPLPSLNEQNEIIVVVKKRIGVVDKLNSLLVKQIEKLKGYRQSLISEVVTGKIKVV